MNTTIYRFSLFLRGIFFINVKTCSIEKRDSMRKVP